MSIALTLALALAPILGQGAASRPFAIVEKSQAAREAAFAELMTSARLVGQFTDRDAPGEMREDSYTITKTEKLDDGRWKFVAVVEFGGREMPVGIKLPVVWAGDDPVITVDDVNFPGLGRYTARILFHGERYVGFWSGEGHGGEMFGRVEPLTGEGKAEDEANAEDELPQRSGLRAAPASDPNQTVNWARFRGPSSLGVARGFATPVEWDVDAEENVLWRTEVPGLAHSSPVVWGDAVFLTTAVRKDGGQDLKVGLYGSIQPIEDESEFTFELHCIDKRSGETRWSRVCWEGVPDVQRHPKSSHAVPSPTVDGERVVVFFGSEGLYSYSHAGELQWKKDLGPMDAGFYMVKDAQWGFGSSPVLDGGRVFVQCDVQEGSFVGCLDAATGEFVWKTERKDVPTWSTPAIARHGGRAQLICNGWKHIGGYDLATGEELWKLKGGGDIPVPTPIVSDEHGLVLITNAHGMMAPIVAIALDAEGELDPSATGEGEPIRWLHRRRGNYMQTPLLIGDRAFFCSDAGILACYDVNTGESIYRERLGEGKTGFSSSGVAADGKLYFASEEGDVYVVSDGEYDVLSVNSLGEECMATPAISEGVLFYRTRDHLVAIGE